MERPPQQKSTNWGLAVTVDIVVFGLFFGLAFLTHTIAFLMFALLFLVIGIPLAVIYRILQAREQRIK